MTTVQDSSKIQNKKIYPWMVQQKPTENVDGSSSVALFRSSLPELEDSNRFQQDTTNYFNYDFDEDEVMKKYASNPVSVLEMFDIFDENQINELAAFIEDKKDLKAFLRIMQHKDLKKDDAVSAMKKVHKKTEKGIKGFIKRTKNVVKKVITDGVSEAVKLAKSERVYYGEKLSENMGEIRTRRDDFSSDGLANVADKFVENEEIKADAMHFITKDEVAGKKLYTEEDVTNAVNVMAENPKDAALFRKNAIELESIKDENGRIRYKGSTIVNVDTKMVQNKELQPTMMKTAHKSDMNDEYLLGITDNLVQTPEMNNALNSFLDCKDQNGKDRFSAKNLYAQTSYMVNKTPEVINTYQTNTLDLAQHNKLSGDNIVATAANITDYPETKSYVYQKVNDPSYSGNQVESFSTTAAQQASNGSKAYASSNNTESNSPASTLSDAKNGYTTSSDSSKSAEANNYSYTTAAAIPETSTNSTNPITAGKNQNSIYTSIAESLSSSSAPEQETYTKQEVSQILYRKYGTAGDLILKKLEENTAFASILKKYGNNKEIIVALINNPDCLDKLTSVSSAITTGQLGEFVKLCTNGEKTDTIAKLIQDFGPQKALQLASKSESAHNQKDIQDVLNTNTICRDDKKAYIENIIDNGKAQKIA